MALLPPSLAGLEGVELSGMCLGHARTGTPHLGWYRARFCEERGAHSDGEIAGNGGKRARDARVFEPLQFHEPSRPID